MTLGILYTPSLMCDAYVFCFEYCTNWELDSYLKQMSVFRLFNFGFIFPFHPVFIVGACRRFQFDLDFMLRERCHIATASSVSALIDSSCTDCSLI